MGAQTRKAATAAGEAHAGTAGNIQARTLLAAAGRSEPRTLTETTQGKADWVAVQDTGALCIPSIIAPRPLMCRQQAIAAGWVPAATPSTAGSTASAHARAEAGAWAQRTLTKATADTGRSACASSRKVQSSQAALWERRGLISLSYLAECQNVPSRQMRRPHHKIR